MVDENIINPLGNIEQAPQKTGEIPSSPEMPRRPEQDSERTPSLQEQVEKNQEEKDLAERDDSQYAIKGDNSVQKKRIKKIENILADGMEDVYNSLPENKKNAFKQAGEDTAIQIFSLIEKGKATAKKIIELIKKWLSIIPGVNNFYLEKEAKIKTDKIIQAAAEENNEETNI